MRFSIVIDDNETILAATAGDEDADAPVPGPGESIGYFDIQATWKMPNFTKA